MSNPFETLESPQETRVRAKRANAKWIASVFRWESKAGRAQDKSVPRTEIGRLLKSVDFSRWDKHPCLTQPKEESCLASAATQGAKGKRRKSANKGGLHVQQFVSPNADTKMSLQVGRFTGDGEAGDDFQCLARVRLGERSDSSNTSVPFAMARPPEGQTSYTDQEAADRAREIAQICNRDLEYITNADLSRVLRELLIEDNRAVQTLGHGNSYYLRPAQAEKLYPVFAKLAERRWISFETVAVLRGEHYAQADTNRVSVAASASIVEDVQAIRAELKDAAAKRSGYTKARSIGRAKAGYNTQLKKLEAAGAKLKLYGDIVEQRLTSEINAAREELRNAFQCLLDGGTVDPAKVGSQIDSAPPTQPSPASEVVSSEPPRVDVVDAPASEPELAAAGADDDDDPFANMF